MFYLKYFCAQIYDAFIICSLFFAFTALCLLLRQGLPIPPYSLWYQLSLVAIYFIYYYFSVYYGGQTLGMRAWQFQLVSCDQGSLTLARVVARLILFLPALFLSICYFKTPAALLRQWSNTKLIHLRHKPVRPCPSV